MFSVKSLSRKWNSVKFCSLFGQSWQTFKHNCFGRWLHWSSRFIRGWLSASETKDSLSHHAGDSNIVHLFHLWVGWEVSEGRRVRPIEKMLEPKMGQTSSDPWSSSSGAALSQTCLPGELSMKIEIVPTCYSHCTIATGYMWALEIWLVGLRNELLKN